VELDGEERAAVTENAKPTVHHIRLQIQRRMSANNHIQTSTKIGLQAITPHQGPAAMETSLHGDLSGV
jgi:hypothetical protein